MKLNDPIVVTRKIPVFDRKTMLRPSSQDTFKPTKKIGLLSRIKNIIFGSVNWIRQILLSAIIVSILLFIVINFYIFASVVNLTTFIYVFLLLSLLTDGIFILLQVFRRKVDHPNVECDPKKLSIVIACYNGADVIEETINHAKRHIPASQIIVVSDASTDNTAEVARNLGVSVIVNETNLSKVFSINKAMKSVHTPYVLLLDDDVLIGDAIIPTSLLDEGYTAVAFNVMPVEEDRLINKLQIFEYRNSMQIGKNMRGKAGAIGNISGAIGLYRTKDLQLQTELHSGQFAGEDEQRTILAHMYGSGKGITFTNQTVTTYVPPTIKSLYRQRAYSWSLAVPELFILYWRILFSPRYHYLLKAEKAYNLYIYMTDPLRLLFLWALILRPQHLLVTFAFYLVFNVLVWVRTGFKDNISTVIIFPFYKLWLAFCRFIGNFNWFKSKIMYMRRRFYKRAPRRRLLAEYSLVFVVFVGLWAVSLQRFFVDMKLYNQIRSNRLEEPLDNFTYEETLENIELNPRALNIQYKTTPPLEGTYISVPLEEGDTTRSVAHKAVEEFIESRSDIENIPYPTRLEIDKEVLASLRQTGVYLSPSGQLMFETVMIENALHTVEARTTSKAVQS